MTLAEKQQAIRDHLVAARKMARTIRGACANCGSPSESAIWREYYGCVLCFTCLAAVYRVNLRLKDDTSVMPGGQGGQGGQAK